MSAIFKILFRLQGNGQTAVIGSSKEDPSGIFDGGSVYIFSQDDDPCNDECNTSTGLCRVADGTSCADGDVCNGDEQCQAGVCTAGSLVSPCCGNGNCESEEDWLSCREDCSIFDCTVAGCLFFQEAKINSTDVSLLDYFGATVSISVSRK